MNVSPAEWIKLTVAASGIDAQLVAGQLEQAGIEVKMEPDRTGYGDFLMAGNNPHAPVYIYVASEDIDEAREVLREASDQSLGEPVSTVDVGTLAAPAGRSIARWIAIALLGILVVSFLIGNAAVRDVIGL